MEVVLMVDVNLCSMECRLYVVLCDVEGASFQWEERSSRCSHGEHQLVGWSQNCRWCDSCSVFQSVETLRRKPINIDHGPEITNTPWCVRLSSIALYLLWRWWTLSLIGAGP